LLPTYVGIGTLEFLIVFAWAKFFRPSGGFLTEVMGISSIIKSANSRYGSA
jgi:hypothetical protein